MPSVPRNLLAVIFVAVFCGRFCAVVHAGTMPTAAGAIEYLDCKNGRISLRAHEVPLLALLQEIAEAASIRIVTASKIQGNQLINTEVRDKPLVETLRSLLEGYSYLVCYQADPSSSTGVHLIAGSTFSPPGGLGEGSLWPAAAAEEGRPARPDLRRGRRDTERASSLNQGHATGVFPQGAQQMKREPAAASGQRTEPSALSDGDAFGDPMEFPAAHEEGGIGGAQKTEEDPVAIEEAALQKNWKREEFLRDKIETLSKNIESGFSDMQYGYWIARKEKKYVTHDRELLEHYEKELATLLANS